eukprot:g66131.t1
MPQQTANAKNKDKDTTPQGKGKTQKADRKDTQQKALVKNTQRQGNLKEMQGKDKLKGLHGIGNVKNRQVGKSSMQDVMQQGALDMPDMQNLDMKQLQAMMQQLNPDLKGLPTPDIRSLQEMARLINQRIQEDESDDDDQDDDDDGKYDQYDDDEDDEEEEETDDEELDFALTYANVEFVSTADPTRSRTVRALVDTGANDSELREKYVRELGLVPHKTFNYETVTGRVRQLSYKAIIRYKGREAVCSVTASSEVGHEDGSNTDEAMLGHSALARLRLLVNPRRMKLVKDVDMSELFGPGRFEQMNQQLGFPMQNEEEGEDEDEEEEIEVEDDDDDEEEEGQREVAGSKQVVVERVAPVCALCDKPLAMDSNQRHICVSNTTKQQQ